jgi:hypothetical protein
MSPTIAESEQGWAGFRKLVEERFQHATLYGLRIERGVAAGYRRARLSRVFDREATARATAQHNESWSRFMCFCAKIGHGTLPEVHFRDGNPGFAQLDEPGRELQPLTRN